MNNSILANGPPPADSGAGPSTVSGSGGGSRQIDLTGGESVYCINTFQIQKAGELYAGEGKSSERVRAIMSRLEADLSRNEQAAIAMLILQKLNTGLPE